MNQDPSQDDTTTFVERNAIISTKLDTKVKSDPELDSARQKIRHRTWTFYSALFCAGLGYLVFGLVFVGAITPAEGLAKTLDGHSFLILMGMLALAPTAILLTLIKEKPGHDIESPLIVVGKELVEVVKTWLSNKAK